MNKMWVVMTWVLLLALIGCTQETQNRFGRGLQNWTGTNGVLEVYSGGKMMRRILEIDKLTTAASTKGDSTRPYRYGYGVLDFNANFVADKGEKKVYFEISDYSTNYFFFENPNN